MVLSPRSVSTRPVLLVLLISLAFVAFVSLPANRQQASAAPDHNAITPSGNTIIVNSLLDAANATDGLCTLREAITAANNNTASGATVGECAAGSSSGSDTISFSVTGTISLTSALADITSDMTINGPGANLLTVQRSTAGGTPNFGIFVVQSGVTATISRLTIAGGNVSGSSGGIANSGTLTLVDGTVRGNTASLDGGGIGNVGTLTLTNSTVCGNSAGGSGGGINLPGTGGIGTVTLTNSTVCGNTGGGIANGGGTVTLTNSTVSGNTGTGISIGAGSLTITNSTVSGNAAVSGGGIINNGVAALTNSTISGNSATSGFGGGIYNLGQLTLTNCTIANNMAGNFGGGIYGDVFSRKNPTTNLKNTIVASNTTASSSGPDLSGTGFISHDFNLIGNTSGVSFTGTTTHDITNVNPLLGPLANNGGATLTHALLAGSPALDAGDDSVTGTPLSLSTDQRGAGFARKVDGPDADTISTVDIGAYEMQGPLGNITDKTTNEDTPIFVPFDPGDPTSISSVTASSSNPTLVSNMGADLNVTLLGSTEVVKIAPAADLFGTSDITITVNRNDGSSASKTFNLIVNSVNDPPVFTKGPDQIVNEDAGAQTVLNWATNFSPGPPNESGQTVNVTVTNSNNSLFSVQPTISQNGTLNYTPAPDANGSAAVNVTLMDDGGTANGGQDTSLQAFTISVNPVNDPPSFTKGADQTVNNNAGTQTINNWATSISAGPPNESGQTVNFQITANTNPGLFTVAPSISASGALTYTPATNAGGTAKITINLKDNGGTASGGQDTSADQTFTIKIIPVGGSLQFNSASGTTTESSGSTTVSIIRTGDLSRAVTVDYATSGDPGLPCATASGVASPKCDFTSSLGTLSFAAGESAKTITILISQDSFVEGPETFTVSLSNQTGFAALATPLTVTITINDDASEPPTNSIDDASNFVRQHYHDFLNREPDSSGLAFWTDQIASCGSDQACIDLKRINVSAAFFLSIEFQDTGYLVERLYKSAYGDATGTSTFGGAHQLPVPIVRFNEFLPDTQEIGQGVVVGQGNWQQQIESNKQAFTLEFVQRLRFAIAFPTSMTPTQFVNKLNTNAGNVLSATERATAIGLFGSATDTSNQTARSQALRQVAEDADLNSAEFNRAFVLMQYFGYLRRNPNDPQDTDYTGYDFWLTKLNQFNGNFINAEMVKSFLVAGEYRNRFGL